MHCSSKITKTYERNATVSYLNRAAGIVRVLTDETPKVREKFLNVDYPQRLMDSINQFIGKTNDKDDCIIPPDLYETPKPLILIKIPYCLNTEIKSKCFLKRSHDFTGNSYNVITKKVKQLFKLKSKSSHPSCVIFEGVCTCQRLVHRTSRYK